MQHRRPLVASTTSASPSRISTRKLSRASCVSGASAEPHPTRCASPIRTASGSNSRLRVSPGSLRSEPHAQPSGEILHELPGDAAGPRAAGGRPFERIAFELFAPKGNAVVRDIALDHGEEFVLAAAMKPEPEAETIR